MSGLLPMEDLRLSRALEWLRARKYRRVPDEHPMRPLIVQLINKRKAEWLCADYRVRARESGCYSRRWEGCVIVNGVCHYCGKLR